MRSDSDRESTRQQHHHKSLGAMALTYCPPWLGWVLLFPVAAVLHLLYGGGGIDTSVVAMVLTLTTVGLVVLTAKLTAARGKIVSKMAPATVGLGCGWLNVAVLVAPWQSVVASAWLLGGLVVCTGWSIRRATLTAKGEAGAGDKQVEKFLEVLNGARLANARTEKTRLGSVVRTTGEVDRGAQTVKDIQDAARHLETLAGLRPGAIIVGGDPEDAGRFTTLITPTDLLANTIPFELDHPGGSIALPVRLGVHTDGEDCSIHFPGSQEEHRNGAHILTQGMTGAGKTQTIAAAMAKVLTRTEVIVLASDPVKGTQSFGPFLQANAFELAAFDLPHSRMMLQAVQRSIAARGSYLGQRGYKQWAAGCGLALVIVWLEEANWATQSDVLTKISEQARSVGIILVVSQQRASYTKTDTDLRANLAAGICAGVSSPMDAKFCLPDDLVDQVGDMVASWRASKPGYVVVCHPSIAPERQAIPVKSEYVTDEEILQVLLDWAGSRAEMDAVTRAAFGPAFAKIRAHMATVLAAQTGVVTPGAPTNVDPLTSDDDLDDEDDETYEDEEFDADDEEDEVGEDAAGVNVDPDKPVPPMSVDMPLGGPEPEERLTTEQAIAVVERHLREMIAKGWTELQAADVAAMRPETTRSREWIRQELIRRVTDAQPDEVALTRDLDGPVGLYGIVVPEMASAS